MIWGVGEGALLFFLLSKEGLASNEKGRRFIVWGEVVGTREILLFVGGDVVEKGGDMYVNIQQQ